MNTERKLITKRDAAFLAAAILIAAALMLFKYSAQAGNEAVVTVDGKEELTVALSGEEKLYTLQNGVVIKAGGGSVSFYESSCKDKICISSGEMSKVGEAAACVPNKTVITVVGNGDIDVLTY